MIKNISVGDSTRGYDSATVEIVNNKYKLVHARGRGYIIRKMIAELNRGGDVYVTKGGDCLTIRVDDAN